ncbi:DUF6371 domain-containing protein [Larkinella humicola]|uniref:DUF6371 domain-containing protein n=1 Tax=Larkinella humicola TaxID=2607654 RepID=UPI0017857070|nr:DUF6371 domain-containing protein [Larkinella humicola]
MKTQAKSYRYQLPKKAIKTNCPACGHKHRKTLSCYIDTQTGKTLPYFYGRCDRESNCGYHLSPYQKGPTGLSYADEVYQRRKEEINHIAGYKPQKTIFHQNKPVSKRPVYCIPDPVFMQSLGHYDRNQFAQLLIHKFGEKKAKEVLQRFQIGTSALWPGACVFWYIDEQGRKRGGQIKLFDSNWHTVKYIDREGKKQSKTSWVHSALIRRYKRQERLLPVWLTEYEQNAERSPCLFGLPQLSYEPVEKPVGIVEAPKTAIICTIYIPDFIWMAVGALSFLNSERLAPLNNRKIMLFPDLNAFENWNRRAELLRAKGFQIEMSDLLERKSTIEQKKQGLDMADFLLLPQCEMVTNKPPKDTRPIINNN